MVRWWRGLPRRARVVLTNLVKLLITIGGFYLLLTHHVSTWNRAPSGLWFAPVDGPVAGLTIQGAPLLDVGGVDALDANTVGYAVDSERGFVYVRLDGGAHPRKAGVVAEGQPSLGSVPIVVAVRDHLREVDGRAFLGWSLVAMAVKFVGVLASAFGWYLLLAGQRLRFPFWQQVVTAWLIGRFIGTFLPSTIGLDSYTLYEAGRYSNEWRRAITAKALEKFLGIAGLFTGLLVTLPAGFVVLRQVAGHRAWLVTLVIGALSAGITGAVVLGLAKPALLRWLLDTFGRVVPGFVGRQVGRFVDAATAYEGRYDILFGALLAKFVAHFATAVVYFFTALAIGVVGVSFLHIVFGSTLQILGTLFSPTIAGEGAREALQALLLSEHLGGAAQAVLSAALGFVAAEAATLWGGAFLWTRTPAWRPRFVEVDGVAVDWAWLDGDEAHVPDGVIPPRR